MRRVPKYETLEKQETKYCEVRPTHCDGNCAYANCNKKEKGRN